MRLELVRDYDEQAVGAARPIYRVREKNLESAAAPGALIELARLNDFNGEAGAVLAGREGVLLGVGDASDPFISAAASEKLPEGDYFFATEDQGPGAALAALGWLFGGYRFDRYKKIKAPAARLIVARTVDLVRVQRMAEAVGLVRDLVNTPASDMLPAALEDEARRIASRYGADVETTVGDDLLGKGFPMIHAVGRASGAAPRLIDVIWGRADAPKLTIIGKGVCFDSGGLDIKPSANMATMKKDMGGAAHALALGQMVMDAGVNVRLRIIIPAVENAISGAAYRPGDVLKSRKGLTVEIGNTDAEGRLVLGDALALAGEERPDLLITLATLTGAARVALGPDLAPYYTDDVSLAADIESAAAEAADPVWRLPLFKSYESMLSSPIADLNNSPNNTFAGSIAAALFLKRFAPENASWAHFDIFAWRPKAAPGRPIGGEAQAIRALMLVIARRFGAGA